MFDKSIRGLFCRVWMLYNVLIWGLELQCCHNNYMKIYILCSLSVKSVFSGKRFNDEYRLSCRYQHKQSFKIKHISQRSSQSTKLFTKFFISMDGAKLNVLPKNTSVVNTGNWANSQLIERQMRLSYSPPCPKLGSTFINLHSKGLSDSEAPCMQRLIKKQSLKSKTTSIGETLKLVQGFIKRTQG